MKLKFPTTNGVEEVKGDQKVARSCYLLAMKHNNAREQVLPIDPWMSGMRIKSKGEN